MAFRPRSRPKDSLDIYQTVDRSGNPYQLSELDREALMNELAVAYDHLSDVYDAFSDTGTHKEQIQALKRVRRLLG